MDKNLTVKTLIIGSVIGALVGAGAAFMLLKRAEQEQTTPKLTASEGVQMGLGVLGLLRLIAGPR